MGGNRHGGQRTGGHGGERTGRQSRQLETLIGAAPGAFAVGPPAYAPIADEVVGHGATALRTLDQRLATAIDDLWGQGWTPAAVMHVVGRRLTTRHAATVGAALLRDRDRQRDAGLSLHPVWERQIAAIEHASPRRRPPAAGSDGGSGPHDAGVDERAVRRRLDALCVLLMLGPVTRVLPRPTRGRLDGPTVPTGLDERMLARVRALLAKAESTDFAAEAEALSTKAQELITRHAVSEVLLQETSDGPQEPSARRVLLDDPYTDAKAALVAAVGNANRCRCVQVRAYGWVTVFGFEADLDAVEVLSASLLVQATRDMRRRGPTRSATGRSTTRSFRRSFLFGYAHRIGERLAQTAEHEVDAAVARRGDVLPALAARDERVAAAQQAAFPRLSRRRASVSNGTGWTAGVAAANEADLTLPAGRLDPGRS